MMRITQVTVDFTETCNIGDYSNTKPSIELTAVLDAADDVHVVIEDLVTLAKGVLHEKIDEELELVGRAPKYWAGPRFNVIQGPNTNFVAIVPSGSTLKLDGGSFIQALRLRDKAARQLAMQLLTDEEQQFFDCTLVDTQTMNMQALSDYAKAQYQAYQQRVEEQRRRQEEERRQREAAWAARRQAEEDEGFNEDDE